MRTRDLADLVCLAALWGASFLFMRIAAPQFGAVPLAALRVTGAALLLLPLLWARGGLAVLARRGPAVALVGVTNSALPFAAFSFAALHINAGLSSVLNATSPMFATLIAMVWLREPAGAWRIAGLVLGLAGVVGLAWDRLGGSAPSTEASAMLGIGLCLLASVLYGFSANFARQALSGVPPLAVAAGSQLSASLALALPAAASWPAANPPLQSWLAVAALALFSTGLAYMLYFRLIARIGPAKAITVTFLVPAFAILWAGVFLGETVTPPMLGACAVILLGTSLATDLLKLPPPQR